MKMTVKMSVLCFLAVAALGARADGEVVRWYDEAQKVTWGYTLANGAATISTPNFWDSNMRDNCTGDIVVPARIGPDGPDGKTTYPVRDMAPGLFRNCTKVTSVTLPDGIRRIAPNAFYFDRNSVLTNIVIGEGCLDICENAFLRCENLVSLNIPNTVTNIGKDAIQLCKVLPRIDIPGSVKTIGDSAFAACYALEVATFGDGIETIDVDAFMNCSSLTAVDLPSSVRHVGDRAFYGCGALASATLREGLATIGFCAFNQCESLCSVSIPTSVVWVGERAFEYCPDSIFDKTTVPGVCLLSGWAVGVDAPSGAIDLFGVNGVADGLFKDCRNVTSVVFPPGMETLGDSMFSGCASLETVGLPVALKSIGDYAFQNCGKLESVSVPSGVTNIGQYAFAYCKKLVDVGLPNGLAAMGDSAFEGCEKLVAVTIPASLKRIPMAAYEWCTNLSSVTVEDGVEIIGNAAFYGCKKLPAFTIPDSVKVVENIAFYNCAFLDTNAIPNVAMADGWIVDSDQQALTEVTVPGDVRGIADEAFSYRRKLTNAVVAAGVKRIPNRCFNCSTQLADVALPDTLEEIDVFAFNNTALGRIWVPSNVVVIGESAFGGSSSLTNVFLPIALKGVVNETKIIDGSFNAKILYYRADGSIDDTCRVVFDANGGELDEAEATRDVKAGASVGALPTPARKKYIFIGWFTEKEWGDKVSAATKIEDNVTFYAHWDYTGIALAVNGIELDSSGVSLTTNLVCGVAQTWSLDAGGSAIKVAGLPAGLKFTAKDILKKGSKTEVEIYANTIYGAPTAASKVDKNKGVIPSEVKITVTTADKSSATYLVKLTVDPLPAWAVGSFEGFVGGMGNGERGTASMSVTAAGKISGKVACGGTNWTFKADSFATEEDGEKFTLEATATAGKASRNVTLDIQACPTMYLPNSATARGDGMFAGESATLFRLPWTDKNDAAPKACLAEYAGTYSSSEILYGDGEEKCSVAFTLDEKGTAKGSIFMPDGTKTRKVAFSANVLPYPGSLYVAFYAPPDAKKGYPEVFALRQLAPCAGPDDNAIIYRDPGVLVTTAARNMDSGATGTVTMNPKYGQAAAGKDVTLTAKAAAGSVFSCWVVAGADTMGLDLTSPTIKLKANGANDIVVDAQFVTRAEDQDEIMLIVDQSSLYGEVNNPGESNMTKRAQCGVAVNWAVRANAYSQTTIKADKLPAGLKLVQDKATKTYSVAGVPTKAGTFPTRFTVTTAGKSKETVLLPIEVQAMPEEIVGSYTGMIGGFEDPADDETWRAFGMVTLSVAANGKLSAKATRPQGAISFAANGWDSESNGFYRVELSTKAGDRLFLKLDSKRDWKGARIEMPDSVFTTAKGPAYLVVAWRNEHGKTGKIATDKTAGDFIARIIALKKLCFKVTGDAEKGFVVEAVPVTDKTANLTLMFDAKGNVKYSGKIGGKSISGTAVLNIDGGDYYTIGDLVVPLSKTEALYLPLGFDKGTGGEPEPGLQVVYVR